MHKLLGGKGDEVLVAHGPHVVALGAEILKTDPHGVFGIGDHIRRPVVEDLQAADLHVALLNIDPAVGHDVAQRLVLGLVLEVELVNQQADGHEIAIGQRLGDFAGGLVHVRQRFKEILDRHGGEDGVAVKADFLARSVFADDGRDFAVFAALKALGAHVLVKLGAHLHGVLRHRLPELARAVLGIGELLDQGRGDLCVRLAERLGQRGDQRLHEGKFLDALRAPIGRDVARMDAPELFGVALKEHLIQRTAEAVDVEVLKGRDRLFDHAAVQIAAAGLDRAPKAHVDERLRLDGDRIVKELAQEINAGNARAQKHRAVFLLRIRAAGIEFDFSVQNDVVLGGRALHGHDLLPEGIDLRILGEEAMAAKIHAVAVVADGLGDAADGVALLDDDDADVVSGLLLQVVCCRQARGAGADDEYGFHKHNPFLCKGRLGEYVIVSPRLFWRVWQDSDRKMRRLRPRR